MNTASSAQFFDKYQKTLISNLPLITVLFFFSIQELKKSDDTIMIEQSNCLKHVLNCFTFNCLKILLLPKPRVLIDYNMFDPNVN